MATSILIARALLVGLRNLGHDPERLLEEVDLDPTRLLDFGGALSLVEFDRLVCRALERAGDPGFGLTLGAVVPLQVFQLFAHLALAERTLRDAFAVLHRYEALAGDAPRWKLTERGSLATLSFEPRFQLEEASRFEIDFTMMILARLSSWFLAGRRCAQQVTFQHLAPRYQRRYRQEFQCSVVFEHAHNSLTISRQSLDVVQPYADATMRASLAPIADALMAEHRKPECLSDRVKKLLRCERDLSRSNLVGLSKQLGLTTRSLRRQLHAESLSLRRVIDDVRRELSCEQLLLNDSSIEAVARRVGFSERSAFHRAFRRWTGMTPTDFVRDRPVIQSARAPSAPLKVASAARLVFFTNGHAGTP